MEKVELYLSKRQTLSMESDSSNDVVREDVIDGSHFHMDNKVKKLTDESNASSNNENLVTKPCFVRLTKIKNEFSPNKMDVSEIPLDNKSNIPKTEMSQSPRKSETVCIRNCRIYSNHSESNNNLNNHLESKGNLCDQSTLSSNDTNKCEFPVGIQNDNHNDLNISYRNGEGNTLNHADISKYQCCCVLVERLKFETGQTSNNFFEVKKNSQNTISIGTRNSVENVSHNVILDDKLEDLSNKDVCKSPLFTNFSTESDACQNEICEQIKMEVQHDSEILSLTSTSDFIVPKLSSATISEIENGIQKTFKNKSMSKNIFKNSQHPQCKESKVCVTDKEQSCDSSHSVEGSSSINFKENCEIMPCYVVLTKIEDEVTDKKFDSDHASKVKPKKDINCCVHYKPTLLNNNNNNDMRQSSLTSFPHIDQPLLNNFYYDPSQPSTSNAILNYDTSFGLPTKKPRDVETPSDRKHIRRLDSSYNSKNRLSQSSFDVSSSLPCTKNCYVKIEKLKTESNYSPLDSEIEKIRKIDCSHIKIPLFVKTEPFSPSSSETNFEIVPDFSNDVELNKFKTESQMHADSNFSNNVSNSFRCPTHYYNPVTGKYCRITNCNVVLTKIDNQMSNFKSTSTVDKIKIPKYISQAVPNMPSTTALPFDPNIPSTSRGGNCNYSMDPCSEGNIKCNETVHILRSGTTISSQRKYMKRNNVSKVIDCKKIKQENKTSSEGQCYRNSYSPEVYVRSSSIAQERLNEQTEKINIHCDDAAIILKSQNTYVHERFVLNPTPTSKVNVKIEPEVVPSTSADTSFNNLERNNNEPKIIIKTDPDSLDEIKTSTSSKKDAKSSKKNCSFNKSHHKSSKRKYSTSKLSYVTKSSYKKSPYPAVISLVSQGTQANSADIRRSVRRIRRAAAQTRKAVASSNQTSSNSSRISGKKITKKPISNHHPDTQDKATSTSDPLLEDDAIQILKMTSDTLLSFTIIACGISDLTIDDCPKLFHLEVQACRILKKLHFSSCSDLQRFSIIQCPKLTIQQLVNPVMSIHHPESYLLVSYEPCMQRYYPGEGEGIILSNTPKNETLLVCHDFHEPSNESIQAEMQDKLMEWLQYLSTAYATLNYTQEENKKTIYFPQKPVYYPYKHDIRRIHGEYIYSSKSEFLPTSGRFQLLSNNPIFCEAFETHKLYNEFPSFSDCEATKDNSLFSKEAIERHLQMNGLVGFYIPVTEYNRIDTYKLPQPD